KLHIMNNQLSHLTSRLREKLDTKPYTNAGYVAAVVPLMEELLSQIENNDLSTDTIRQVRELTDQAGNISDADPATVLDSEIFDVLIEITDGADSLNRLPGDELQEFTDKLLHLLRMADIPLQPESGASDDLIEQDPY